MFSVEEARHKRPHLVGSHVGEMSEAEKPQSQSVVARPGGGRIGNDGSRDSGFLWVMKTLRE